MRGTSGGADRIWYAAWLAQPGYVATEVLLALVAGVGYSLADDTISALGTVCVTPAQTGCSSAPVAMNIAFVGFGALQALGALPLLRTSVGAGGDERAVRRTRLVGWLWVVAGACSVGVGLAPVDTHPTLHSLVALPVFVAQPVAVLLHARWLTTGRLRRVGTALGVAAILGALAFGALLGSDAWSGAAERLAVWPAKVWLPLAAVALHRTPHRPHGPEGSHRSPPPG